MEKDGNRWKRIENDKEKDGKGWKRNEKDGKGKSMEKQMTRIDKELKGMTAHVCVQVGSWHLSNPESG